MEEIKKLIEEKLSGIVSEKDLKMINESIDNAVCKVKYTLSIPKEYKSTSGFFTNDYIKKSSDGYMYIDEGLRTSYLTKDHLFSEKEIDKLPNQRFIKSLNKEVYKGE